MSETQQQSKPPARLGEAVFRRFEKVIYKTVTTFPSQIVVETKSPNAFACQFRSAMKSLYHFQWQTNIPHNQFIKLYEAKDIVVREFMNNAVTIQMEQAEWENQPRGEACVLIPDRQADRYHIQGADAHQNGEF